MGKTQSKNEQPTTNAFLFGQQGVGKTTLLNQMVYGENGCLIHLTGFKKEYLTYKNRELMIWDVEGRDVHWPLYHHYYQDIKVLILVIESQIDSLYNELSYMQTYAYSDQSLAGVPVIIVANKQDIPGALDISQIEKIWQRKDRKVMVIGATANQAIGVNQVLELILYLT